MPRAVTIWRLEDSTGEGPFRSSGVAKVVYAFERVNPDLACRHDPRNHRGPWEDGLGRAVDRGYVFGCRTLKQYRLWFSHPFIRRGLAKDGFRLCKYRVPAERVLQGHTQIAFDRLDARLIETRAPDFR